MYYKQFIELNLPIGTKVRYEEYEWLYIGLGIYDKKAVIQLAKNDSESSSCTTENFYHWNSDEIEVIEYPVKYMSIAKYHVGDIVYNYDVRCIILEERDENGCYLVYHYEMYETHLIPEENFTLEKQECISEEIKKGIEEGEIKNGKQ
jgi:hypothetical protein